MMPSDRQLAAELATSDDDEDDMNTNDESVTGDAGMMMMGGNKVKSKPKRSHWVGRTVDGYAVTGEFWDSKTGETWLLRKDQSLIESIILTR